MYCDDVSAQQIALAQQGDAQAAEAILLCLRPLLWSLSARLHVAGGISREELVQAGHLGLLKALGKYDPAQQTRLITYAVPWILGEMRRAIRRASPSCLSLDAPRGEEGTTLGELLPGSDGVDTQRLDLRMAFQRLNEEEQLLLCLRYFRDKTQSETAELMRRSQTQISRMERRALDRLHEWLA